MFSPWRRRRRARSVLVLLLATVAVLVGLTLAAPGPDAVPGRARDRPGRRAAAGVRRVTRRCGTSPSSAPGRPARPPPWRRWPNVRERGCCSLDRERFPRDKSCGDGIAPHVLDVLGPLGAGDVVDGWTRCTGSSSRCGRRTVSGRMARPGWVIPREVFDARLVDRAVRRGRPSGPAPGPRRSASRPGRWSWTGGSGPGSWWPPTAPHSAVRERPGRRPAPRRAIALRGYAPTPAGRAGRQVIRYGDGASRRTPGPSTVATAGPTWATASWSTRAGQASRRHLLDQLERLLPGTVATTTRWPGHHLPLSSRRLGRPARRTGAASRRRRRPGQPDDAVRGSTTRSPRACSPAAARGPPSRRRAARAGRSAPAAGPRAARAAPAAHLGRRPAVAPAGGGRRGDPGRGPPPPCVRRPGRARAGRRSAHPAAGGLAGGRAAAQPAVPSSGRS